MSLRIKLFITLLSLIKVTLYAQAPLWSQELAGKTEPILAGFLNNQPVVGQTKQAN